MSAKSAKNHMAAAPKPSTTIMLLISVIVGMFVPPAIISAKIFLTVLPKTEDPTSSLLQVRDMLLGDGRMLLAFMVFFPVIGFVVQKYILWKEGRSLFTIKRTAPPVSD